MWCSSFEKGKHTKFQKLWIGAYTIASILGSNAYLLKDDDEFLLSYPTNGAHLKPFLDPTTGFVQTWNWFLLI